MTRDERQRLGVKKWINSGCRGTLVWSTGVGVCNGTKIKNKINYNLLWFSFFLIQQIFQYYFYKFV